MRVLVNTLTADGPRTGIGHYTGELVRCLRQECGDEVVGTFPGGWLRFARACWARGQGGGSASTVASWGRIRQTFQHRLVGLARHAGQALIRLAFRYAARGGYDLYHEPNYIPLECELPTVATVHDLSVLLHPHWHPAARVAQFEKHFESGLKRCRHLFAISESGKREIVRHLGWPADKVSVTYMGVRDGLRRVEGAALTRALGELGLEEGYLLHVGTLEPRKNVLMLLRAYCALPASVRRRRPLVLAGGKGWNSEEVHRYLHDEARHRNVRWLGYVADRHVAALYSGARALLFPTFYEGFGIPTIEMLACGGGVIASTAAAVAETVGGQAELIDPYDGDGWRQAMLRVCVDHDWWRSLCHGGEQVASRFSWRLCAQRTLDAYRSVCQPTLTRAA